MDSPNLPNDFYLLAKAAPVFLLCLPSAFDLFATKSATAFLPIFSRRIRIPAGAKEGGDFVVAHDERAA
jgi:hypothetical protein